MPFCTKHYMLRKGSDCARYVQSLSCIFETSFVLLRQPCCLLMCSCGERVPADVMVTALGRHYHPACLRCVNCTKEFSPGARMFSSTTPGDEQRPMCESCHKAGSEPCTSCREPLRTGKFVAVRGSGQFHARCLVCAECSTHLTGDVQSHEGRLYCADHYRQRLTQPAAPVISCARCNLGIGDDDGVTALDQNWHAACFRCSEGACDVDIASEGRYYDIDRMPFCTKHYMLRKGEPCVACGKRCAIFRDESLSRCTLQIYDDLNTHTFAEFLRMKL